MAYQLASRPHARSDSKLCVCAVCKANRSVGVVTITDRPNAIVEAIAPKGIFSTPSNFRLCRRLISIERPELGQLSCTGFRGLPAWPSSGGIKSIKPACKLSTTTNYGTSLDDMDDTMMDIRHVAPGPVQHYTSIRSGPSQRKLRQDFAGHSFNDKLDLYSILIVFAACV